MQLLRRILCLGGHREPRELWATGGWCRYACDYCGAVSSIRGTFVWHSPADDWELGFSRRSLERSAWAGRAAEARALGLEFTEPEPYTKPDHPMPPPPRVAPIPRRESSRIDLHVHGPNE